MSESKDPVQLDEANAVASESPPGAEASEGSNAPSAESPESPAAERPEEAERADAAAARPGKKGKKKRKKRAEGSVEERPALDAKGRERPRFLLRFPNDPALEPLIAAFEAGNFARVREEAPRLIERTERADVKRAAEELLRRIEPDPLLKFFLGVAVAFFVAVVAYVYYVHG